MWIELNWTVICESGNSHTTDLSRSNDEKNWLYVCMIPLSKAPDPQLLLVVVCVCVFTTGWVKCRVQIFATSLSLPFCIWHYKFSSQSGKFLHFKHEILTFCAKFEQHIYKVCLWIKLCISEVSEGDSQFQFHLSILNASPALWAIVLFFYYILIARKLF